MSFKLLVAAMLVVLLAFAGRAEATVAPTTGAPTTAAPTLAPSKSPTTLAHFCASFTNNKACLAHHTTCQWRGKHGCGLATGVSGVTDSPAQAPHGKKGGNGGHGGHGGNGGHGGHGTGGHGTGGNGGHGKGKGGR